MGLFNGTLWSRTVKPRQATKGHAEHPRKLTGKGVGLFGPVERAPGPDIGCTFQGVLLIHATKQQSQSLETSRSPSHTRWRERRSACHSERRGARSCVGMAPKTRALSLGKKKDAGAVVRVAIDVYLPGTNRKPVLDRDEIDLWSSIRWAVQWRRRAVEYSFSEMLPDVAARLPT